MSRHMPQPVDEFLMMGTTREPFAKAEGKYKGRKPTAIAHAQRVKELQLEGMKPNKIAEVVGISRASVYRCLQE